MSDSHPGNSAAHQPLDPRVIPLEQIVHSIVVAAISLGSLVGIGIFWLVADDVRVWVRTLPLVAWLGWTMFGLWHARTWPARAYGHTSYRVDDEGLEIRRGVYWRVVINVPRSRVQHIDVTQGPLDRRYGLGTLVIYTAGTDYAKVELHGLEHGRALALREQLLPTGAGDAV